MMFLTKGDLYHSSTWELWFQYAQDWLPAGPVKAACSKPEVIQAAQKACKRRERGTGEDILANQHLFNVYIHVGLNNQDFRGACLDWLPMPEITPPVAGVKPHGVAKFCAGRVISNKPLCQHS